MWTGMTARVRVVIFCSICATSMHHVWGSLSTRTGTQPRLITANAQEIIVKVGRMTSSPGSSSRQSTATWRATVPLLTAMPYFRPQYDAHFCANSSINLPAAETQPVRTHSRRYSDSCGPRRGSLTGITVRTAPSPQDPCKVPALPRGARCLPACEIRVPPKRESGCRRCGVYGRRPVHERCCKYRLHNTLDGQGGLPKSRSVASLPDDGHVVGFPCRRHRR